jgi:thiamine biosynthesis lipoprotein
MMTNSRATRITVKGEIGRADFRALGTGVTVLTADPGRIAAASLEVHRELVDIDEACSRFRPDSELEVANRSSGHVVTISPLLSEATGVALRAAEITGGDLDPTVGEAMKVIGYDRDFSEIRPDPAPLVRVGPVRGWTSVRLNRRWGTLYVPAGITLDLGATAKALAADRAAARAAGTAGGGVLVSLGGDIATAGEPPPNGWHIRVADWHGDGGDAPGQTVCIVSGGLATSSTTVRRWERGGQSMHHIIDPRTARPAKVVWRTVSVTAANCVDANIASTTSIIRGERALPWLASLGLDARLVRPDGAVTVVGAWPGERVAA